MIVRETGDILHIEPHPVWDSRRLWSWWDMLVQHAWRFFLLSRFLVEIHSELGLPPPRALEQAQLGIAPTNALAAFGGLGGIGSSLSPPPPLPDVLTLDLVERIPKLLELIKSICSDIDLIDVGKDIDRAINHINGGYPRRDEARFHIKHITDRITDDMQSQYFLHVKSDKVRYYRDSSIFGENVARKFPKAAEDIESSGKCFALGQYTATVFHLMRVMEHCVQRFGKKLKAPINIETETWYQIMDHVHKAVNALPSGKKATARQNKMKEEYAMAAGRLDHVRIVWRNPVMHPKETYDENQSSEVLEGVGKFLQSITGLV
jgi:hypothetical protein